MDQSEEGSVRYSTNRHRKVSHHNIPDSTAVSFQWGKAGGDRFFEEKPIFVNEARIQPLSRNQRSPSRLASSFRELRLH